MFIRKTVALMAIAAIALAACSSPAGSSGPGASGAGGSAAATACKVGVAWSTFQEERYGLRDEPGLKGAVEAGGGTYIGNDAKNNADFYYDEALQATISGMSGGSVVTVR